MFALAWFAHRSRRRGGSLSRTDEWKIDAERRALTGLADDRDVAAALFNNAVNDRQAETGALPAFFRGEKRLEQFPPRLFVDPRSGIGHAEANVTAGSAFHQRDAVVVLIDFFDADGHAPTVGHRIACVDDEVQHDLFGLPGIGENQKRLRRADDLEVDFRSDEAAEHGIHASNDVSERED